MIPGKRRSTHPGETLYCEFMRPTGWTIEELSKRTGLLIFVLEEFIDGKVDVTPHLALQLSNMFKTSPEFWLTLQLMYDTSTWKQQILEEYRLKKLANGMIAVNFLTWLLSLVGETLPELVLLKPSEEEKNPFWYDDWPKTNEYDKKDSEYEQDKKDFWDNTCQYDEPDKRTL